MIAALAVIEMFASYLCLEAHPMFKHLLVVHGDPQIVHVIH